MKNYFIFSILLISTSAFSRGTCNDLDVGVAVKVDIGHVGSKSNVEQKYTLKRISNLQYESYVNLEFIIHRDLKKSEINTSEFKNYVKSCYEQFNHRLVDEKGRALSIKLFDNALDSEIPKPPKVNITIMPEKFRAHAKAYNVDIDCETVVHESLHLMGLGDDYVGEDLSRPNFLERILNRKVEKPEEAYTNDCRAIGPLNSVMNNQHFLTSDVQVLFSGQMDTIIYPHCKSKNNEYYSCVRKAYRTSRDHGSIRGCGKMDDVCKTFNWLLSKDSPLRDTPEASLKLSERTTLNMKFLFNK